MQTATATATTLSPRRKRATTKARPVVITGESARFMRKKLGQSQGAFWPRLGVTQSAGSRYESDTAEQVRGIPEPVQILLRLACGTKAQAAAALSALRGTAITLSED